MDVVHVAVAVVVDAGRAAELGGVDPHVGGQVGMRVVHAGVDDGDHDVTAAAGLIAIVLQPLPGGRHIGCIQVPLLRIEGIREVLDGADLILDPGLTRRLAEVVRLGQVDTLRRCQRRDRGGHIQITFEAGTMPPGQIGLRPQLALRRHDHRPQLGRASAGEDRIKRSHPAIGQRLGQRAVAC